MLASVLAGTLIALLSLTGCLFLPLLSQQTGRLPPRASALLLSLGASTMLCSALLHTLPDLFHGPSSPRVPPTLLLGFALSLATDLAVSRLARKRSFGVLSLAADALHNLLDGVTLAACFAASFASGVASTLLVALHEVPQELGDFAVLLSSGFSPRHALLWNALSAATCPLGALLAAGLDGVDSSLWLALAAGGVLYTAAAGVLPELLALLAEPPPARQPGTMRLAVLGALLGLAVTVWVPHEHHHVHHHHHHHHQEL